MNIDLKTSVCVTFATYKSNGITAFFQPYSYFRRLWEKCQSDNMQNPHKCGDPADLRRRKLYGIIENYLVETLPGKNFSSVSAEVGLVA